MKYTIFNCSPKLGKNNTAVLLEQFAIGLQKSGAETEIYKLNQLESLKKGVALFQKAEAVILAFPLYCYAMPGGVKLLIEELEPVCGKLGGKPLGFLVQYGFREAIHARPLEGYLKELAALLDCAYIGTIIKGGCDGLASGNGANKKTLQGIYEIGQTLGRQGQFDQKQLDTYSAPEFEKKQSAWVLSLVCKLVNKFYWGASLKKNGVSIEESYARPYAGIE